MKKIDTQIGELILQKLKEKNRNVSWLAKQIDCDVSNLSKTLKNSHYIYFDLVYHISKTMDEDFFAYGSQKLNETKFFGKIHQKKQRLLSIFILFLQRVIINNTKQTNFIIFTPKILV
jgi:hypothetical protein